MVARLRGYYEFIKLKNQQSNEGCKYTKKVKRDEVSPLSSKRNLPHQAGRNKKSHYPSREWLQIFR